jgi:hypothetical protein
MIRSSALRLSLFRILVRFNDIPFGTTDWSTGPAEEHKGVSGFAEPHRSSTRAGAKLFIVD